ncbi:glycosyltransferase family 2 protein [Alistipes sp.]|uniref:glycosyltransferase family 2 protein n=1 Tax=Alistipes sp. TaxID=1872444 RepID=UPI003AF12A0D
MTTAAILFWLFLAVVFYTYLGYGMLLRALVSFREAVCPRRAAPEPESLPEVTLLIAAYNEQEIVAAKTANCRALEYPAGRLHVVWITDGSTDRTVELLAACPEVRVLHDARRGGKTAALNRAMQAIETPIVIFTDANTMLNPEAVREIVRCFDDPKVGCVAGEKRVAARAGEGAAATEGVYWRYESKLKEWDFRLSTAVGAAGELFAVRRELYEPQSEDTLLDDFMISMRIAGKGYRIAYCKEAYALETPSADMAEEGKRKRRIAAGGLQSVWRLRGLLNPLRHGVLTFQYLSHRVLRWTLTPLLLAALLPLNVVLLWSAHPALYAVVLTLQTAFYLAALAGWLLERRGRRNRWLFIPYYFLFMNLNVFRGAHYLATHRSGAWEKARRAG